MATLVENAHQAATRPKALGIATAPRLIGAGAIAGGVVVAVGAFLPWVSIYAGLESFRGVAGLYGRLLVGGGGLSVLLGLLYLRRPGAALRWGISVLGATLLAFCGWLLVQLFVVYREIGGNPFVVGRLDSGLYVSTVGAAIVLLTLLVEPRAATDEGRAAARAATVASNPLFPLALLSASAGLIHLTVLGEHLHEYVLYGAFFATAGTAQLVWALLVPMWRPRIILLAGIVGNALVILLWSLSRTSGLPLGPEAGSAEPVGFADTLTVIDESLIVIGTILVLARTSRAHPRVNSRALQAVAWAVLAAVVPLTVLGILRAVGATSPVPHV